MVTFSNKSNKKKNFMLITALKNLNLRMIKRIRIIIKIKNKRIKIYCNGFQICFTVNYISK